jgi:hypothetical protein
MKKHLLSTSVLALALASQAQITIDSTYGAIPGDIYTLLTDTAPTSSLSAGNNGAAQQYDMSDFTADFNSDETFVSPQEAARLDTVFPETTVALDFDFGYFAMEVSDTAWLQTAVAFTTDGINYTYAAFDDPLTIAKFPTVYEDSFSDSSYFQVETDFDGTPIRVTNEGQTTQTADAWGELTFGADNYNVLRVHSLEYNHQLIEVDQAGFWIPFQETYDTSNVYTYFGETSKFPLATLTYNKNEDILRSVELNNEAQFALSVNDFVQQNELSLVYPNPTVNNFKVETNKNIRSVELVSMNGKVIRPVFSGKTVEVSTLSAGTYLVNMVLENGEFKMARLIKK